VSPIFSLVLAHDLVVNAAQDIITLFLDPVPCTLLHALDSVKVVSVTDGDTLRVTYKEKEERIRLIGTDALENRENERAIRESEGTGNDIDPITRMGKKATRYVEELVRTGDQVSIEFDVEKRDRYGRLLGYVYLSDGRMLNEETLKAGYANLLTHPPNVRFKDRFLEAYREARERKKGLWK
jgi:micrococcal nuclease